MASIDNTEDLDSTGLVQKRVHAVNEYIVNFDDEILAPNEYREVYELLRNANESDVIRLVINSWGGDAYTFVQLYNYLMRTRATTIAELHVAYSAGSMISLSCDIIEVQEFSSMMIHDLSSGSFGKMKEIVTYVDFMKKWGSELIDTIYDGFLTKSELKEVKKGQDIWLVKEDIEKKLKKWTPMRGIIEDAKS